MSNAASVHSEKRRSIRPRRLRRALCVYNDATSTLDVVVRNISPDGAKIAGHGLIFLPRTFELRILDEAGGYSARSVRVVWNKGETAGLAFVD
jgi:PilZ domain